MKMTVFAKCRGIKRERIYHLPGDVREGLIVFELRAEGRGLFCNQTRTEY